MHDMNEIVHPKGKLYYSMGEVCELFGVRPSLLRFWEENFSILNPRRNSKGNRLFSPADVDTVGLIYNLVKERGMTLAGAEKKIKQDRKGKNRLNKNVEIIQQLQKIRNLLREVKEDLDNDENVVARFDDDYPADEPTVTADIAAAEIPQTAVSTEIEEKAPAPKRRESKGAKVVAGSEARPVKRGRKKKPTYEEQYLDLFSMFDVEQVSVDVTSMEQMNGTLADEGEAVRAAWEESTKRVAADSGTKEENETASEREVVNEEVVDEDGLAVVATPQKGEGIIEVPEQIPEPEKEEEREPKVRQVFF